jgi:hypothetical protein
MRMDGIFTQEELMEITGVRQRAALRKALRHAHIRFHETNGRIWTTQSAIDAPLVGREKKDNRGPNLDAITTKGPG